MDKSNQPKKRPPKRLAAKSDPATRWRRWVHRLKPGEVIEAVGRVRIQRATEPRTLIVMVSPEATVRIANEESEASDG